MVNIQSPPQVVPQEMKGTSTPKPIIGIPTDLNSYKSKFQSPMSFQLKEKQTFKASTKSKVHVALHSEDFSSSDIDSPSVI